MATPHRRSGRIRGDIPAYRSIDVPRVIIHVWLPDSFRMETSCAAIAWDAELGEPNATFKGIRTTIARETGWDAANVVLSALGARLGDVFRDEDEITTGGPLDVLAYESDKMIRLVAPHATARSFGITLDSKIADLVCRVRAEHNIVGGPANIIQVYNGEVMLHENTRLGDIVFTQLLTEVHNCCAIRVGVL